MDGNTPYPGQLVGSVQLGEAHSPDDYAVWVFETADSALGNGTFVSWHVPAALGDVILVETCGSDTATRDEIDVRDRRAGDAVDAINEAAAGDPFEPSRFVLEADRRHRLLVSWSWTGRRVPDPAGTAEADRVDCGDAETQGTTVTQQFTFRTAPDYVPLPVPADAGPPSEPDPGAADIEYTSFDVRDLRHYLKTVPTVRRTADVHRRSHSHRVPRRSHRRSAGSLQPNARARSHADRHTIGCRRRADPHASCRRRRLLGERVLCRPRRPIVHRRPADRLAAGASCWPMTSSPMLDTTCSSLAP